MDKQTNKPFYLHPLFIAWAIVFVATGITLTVFYFLCVASLETMIFKGAMESFNALKSNLSIFTLVSFAILVLTANLAYWKTRQGFPILLSFLLFAAFIYLDWFQLSQKYFTYKKNHDMLFGEHNFAPLIGAALMFSGFLLTIGNLILLWLRSSDSHKKLARITAESANVKQDTSE